MPRPLRLVAVVASGLLLSLVSPPIGLHWLHWFSFVPALVALEQEDVPGSRGRNFRLGWLLGTSAVGSLFFWLTDTITTFSNIPFPAALAILALFSGVFSLPYGVLMMIAPLLRQRFGQRWIFLFPAAWVAAECLQPALFPYYQGVGQYRFPYTWQLASVFGATSLSYLVLLTNSALAALWIERRDGQPLPLRPLAIVASLFAANLAFGAWRYEQVEAALAGAPVLRASIVQQGVTMVQRLQDRGGTVLKSWEKLTADVLPDHPDLVVWPEGAIWGNPDEGALGRRLSALAREGETHLLLGGGTSQADPLDVRRRVHWNSCYLFDPNGEVTGRYDKMVPLPFGEYLPWPFSYLRPYIEGVGDFRAGTHPEVFEVNGVRDTPVTFSTPICYEAILESQMRRMGDVDLFVNITNDAWFGDTAAPHQHAMLAAVHATELGRPLLRIAYTGVSMVVDPAGVIREETQPYTDVAKVVDVPLVRFETPYRTWGRAFPWTATVVGLVAGFLAWRRRGVVTATPPAA